MRYLGKIFSHDGVVPKVDSVAPAAVRFVLFISTFVARGTGLEKRSHAVAIDRVLAVGGGVGGVLGKRFRGHRLSVQAKEGGGEDGGGCSEHFF